MRACFWPRARSNRCGPEWPTELQDSCPASCPHSATQQLGALKQAASLPGLNFLTHKGVGGGGVGGVAHEASSRPMPGV
jgi:hypothetical protein